MCQPPLSIIRSLHVTPHVCNGTVGSQGILRSLGKPQVRYQKATEEQVSITPLHAKAEARSANGTKLFLLDGIICRREPAIAFLLTEISMMLSIGDVRDTGIDTGVSTFRCRVPEGGDSGPRYSKVLVTFVSFFSHQYPQQLPVLRYLLDTDNHIRPGQIIKLYGLNTG